MQIKQVRRGAAGMQYATVIGLVAVVAIASIAALGGTMSSLLNRTGNVMRTVSNGALAGSGGSTDHGIVMNGSARNFADGTQAPSCQAYRNPPAGYSFSGDAISGFYYIKPATSVLMVECGMTLSGGGWTKIGSFNGTTSQTLMASTRNAIAYREVMISETPGDTIVHSVLCNTVAATGFAVNSTAGYNCSADATLSIRVEQEGNSTGGNYGIYHGTLMATGGCNWASDLRAWGRHYGGGSICVAKGSGESYISSTAWGTEDRYTLWVR